MKESLLELMRNVDKHRIAYESAGFDVPPYRVNEKEFDLIFDSNGAQLMRMLGVEIEQPDRMSYAKKSEKPHRNIFVLLKNFWRAI